MEEFLIKLSTEHAIWVYIITISTAWLGGPVFSMIFGALIKLDYFPLIPVYIALMLGELLGDTAWYFIGQRYGHQFIKKYGKYVSVTEDTVTKIIHLFHKYHDRIIIISKITNGFGFSFVTLMTAGIARIPFFKFLSLNLIGQFIWSGLLIAVGYFFSQAYLAVDDALGKISLVAFFLLLIAAFMGFIKYLKNKTVQ